MEPALDVEFASAQFEERTDGKRSSEQMDETRHGSLIENMYGVEGRSSQLYKRVKVEENGPRSVNHKFTGVGNTGLGNWMKDGRSNPNSPAVLPDVVDLTTGRMMDMWVEMIC